ncbi:MAG: hypothetical protein JSV68_03970 [Anaerolineaceae bacterium]|nr:MAG: hypothetical protein JSV68_03970 [Anaerolineaceae bacterium]
MSKKFSVFSVFGVLLLGAIVAMFLISPGVASADRGGEGGRGDGPVIYVAGQGLYYDSIVTADPLPAHGPFQDLIMGENGLETEFGPGDHGYVGGRWRLLDGDGNVVKYFSCPLLGPGRDAP